jgi:hypothetical protein
MTTYYRIRDARGQTTLTTDAERADRLARAGLRVTATTVGR